MFNLIRAALRDFLLGDTTITNLVSTRIFAAELAEVRNPTFPLINFRLQSGTNVSPTNEKVTRNTFFIWVHSLKHWSESYDIYDKVRTKLLGAATVTTDVTLSFRETSLPVELFDDANKIYSIRSTWFLQGQKK